MKLFVFALFVAAATADRLENTYLPPNSAKTAGGNANFLNTPINKAAAPSGAYGAPGGSSSYSAGPTQAPIGILRQDNENNGDGQYKFEFETENRISQQESGQLKNAGTDQESNVVQGSYTYTGDDGVTYTVNYVADENGFQPIGAHIPTAPPVPEDILKALEQNAADEAAGIVDDGQYHADRSEGIAGNKYLAPKAGGASSNNGYKY